MAELFFFSKLHMPITRIITVSLAISRKGCLSFEFATWILYLCVIVIFPQNQVHLVNLCHHNEEDGDHKLYISSLVYSHITLFLICFWSVSLSYTSQSLWFFFSFECPRSQGLMLHHKVLKWSRSHMHQKSKKTHLYKSRQIDRNNPSSCIRLRLDGGS